jgi:non-ribosomal peptide synthetase component F
VRVTHDNVVRAVPATEPGSASIATTSWTLFHSYAFDFSVWELWGALLYGGRVVVVPLEGAARRRLPRAARARAGHGAEPDAVGVPPLIEAGARSRDTPLALRYVIFGGEALELQASDPGSSGTATRSPS